MALTVVLKKFRLVYPTQENSEISTFFLSVSPLLSLLLYGSMVTMGIESQLQNCPLGA